MREAFWRGLRVSRWVLPMVVLLAAEPVQAYCRTRTCEFRRRMPCNIDPVTGCSLDGPFVFWPDGCIPFAVQRDGSVLDGVSAATLEAIVEDGFRVWSEVRCPGGTSPELSAASQGPVACDAVEYDCTEREANSNVVMFRDEFIDEDPGLHFGIIALTTLTANLRTGEVYDADMEINTRDEDFVLEGGGGIVDGPLRDLRGVVIHELGHLLGLSHSREPGALMREGYEGIVEPASDDIAGICAALETAREDPLCDLTPLGADAGCVGHDVSCTSSSRPADGEDGADGCACELARPASGRPAPWQGGLPVASAVAALLFRYSRRSRRARTVL